MARARKAGGHGGRRAPGRPGTGAPSQREALIDAARELFSHRGFAGTTLRQVAAEARVTPALAVYYFGGKEGLLAAVVDERLAPLVGELAGELRGAREPAQALAVFVRGYTRLAAANPWLPQLIVREVLSEGGVLRDAFPRRFAGEMAAALKGVVEHGQRTGALRSDVDPARAVLSVISLCIFPFLAGALVSDVLGIRTGPESAAELAEHHLSILSSGLTGLPP